MKRKQIGSSLILIAVLIQAFLLGTSLAQSTVLSTQFIMGGVYPGAPTYTVWKEDAVTYAKDANGQVDFYSTNSSYVINSAIGTGEGTVYLKNAEYPITASVLINYNNTWLVGESREGTILSTSSNIDIIKIYPHSGYIENIKIQNLWLDGMGVGSTSMGLNATGYIWYSTFDQITTTNNYDGIHFQSTFATRGARSKLSFIHAKYNLRAGLYFQEQDAFNLYKIDSHENVYGLFIEELCQGFVVDSYRGDENTSEDIRIQGDQGVKILNSWISQAGTYGIYISGGSNDITIEDTHIEASTESQIFITNSYVYSNYDIKIFGCRIVRGQTNGITISGSNNRNNTNIRIEGNTIINNGQATNNTYWGIEAFGTGATNATKYVYINNNYIGNDPEETGAIRQRGIQSVGNSNYFQVIGNDVSTSLWTAAITEQITLAGANNIIEHNFGDV